MALLDLEAKLRELGRALKGMLPPSMGYTLFLFDYGDKGFMTYMSTATREDMIASLEETLARLKLDVVAPHGQPNHSANKPGKA
jgi:hypothetical protein